jgi:hypothetical protein
MLWLGRDCLMYGTDHDVPYLYIRNSALQDRGEQRPLRASPIGQGRRRGDAPTNSGPDNYCCLSYWCTRPQEVARHTEAERSGEGLGHRGGAERRAGAPYHGSGGSSDPMREADVRARRCCRYRLAWCARPTGGSHGLTTDALAQRIKGARRRPRPTGRKARPRAL